MFHRAISNANVIYSKYQTCKSSYCVKRVLEFFSSVGKNRRKPQILVVSSYLCDLLLP